MNTSSLNPNIERQVGPTWEAIRNDHKERYIWASERLKKSDNVIDAGCGVGYGSALLAEHASSVHAIDISGDAIEYANRYWTKPNISHAVEDLSFFKMAKSRRCDVIVAFEVVEHLIEPRLFLIRAFEALKPGGRIFVSVPNEKVIPHTVSLNPFHLRHYTLVEIKELLLECGFDVTTVASQNTKEIADGDTGQFLILESLRREKRPAGLDHADIVEHALNSAASFIVARAMALHKTTKYTRTLKSKLDETNKTLSAGEARSEPQLKLLQFLEGLQTQSNTSRESLVSDMMRRLKEVETFERELRDRLMQAEVQHARALADFERSNSQRVEMSSQIEQITLDRELALQTASDERMTLESEIVALKEQAEVQHARALADFERSNSQRVAMSSQIEQITLDRELALQTASDERMTLESEIVALKEQFEKMSALAEQRDGLKNKLHQTLVELDVAKKQASSVKEMSNSMAVRLLAFGRDHHLVMEASAELVQKLETSETEISRLTRTTEALRNELQSNSSTSVKAPPTLGNIYKKLRFHRFYLPFLYKAVRNSVRNQSKRFQAKA